MLSGLNSSSNNSKKPSNRGIKEDLPINANSSIERQDTQKPRMNNIANEFERNEQDEQSQVADIISQILNQRKPQVTDSNIQNMHGFLNDEGVNVRHNLSNLAYEIKNKDTNGRAILHKAAMDHKPDDMKQILREYTKRPGRLDVNQPDDYGNTALILSCVFNPLDEKKQKEQMDVVQQLIDFNIKSTEENHHPNSTINRSGTFRMHKNPPPKNAGKLLTPLDQKNQEIENEKKRQEILNQRYEQSVKINARNHQTLFTALHWACIYGRYEIVELLLNSGAKQFIPDADGFFPIDYAGIFSHENLVKLLIVQHLTELDNSRQDYNETMEAAPSFGSKMIEVRKYMKNFKNNAPLANIKAAELVPFDQQVKILQDRKIDFWKFYKLGKQRYGSELGEEAPMMFSPIFTTRLLYWATMTDIDEVTFKRLLSDQNMVEAYPEGPVMSIGPHYRRSPIHAAAMRGKLRKLDMMLEDVRKRYQTDWDDLTLEQQQQQIAKIEPVVLNNQVASKVDIKQKYKEPMPTLIKHNIYPFGEGQTWSWHMGMGNSRDNNIYIAKLTEYRASAIKDWEYKWKSTQNNYSQDQMFTYDFFDSHNNTPLHLASQKINQDCIDYLTRQTSTYKMRDDLRNLSGHTAADILRQNSYQKKQYSRALTQFDDENQMLESSKQMILKKNQLQVLVPALLNNERPYSYLQNKRDTTIKNLRKERKLLPQAPRLIMKVDVRADNPKKANIVNSMLQNLKLSKFQIQMVQSVDLDIFYVGLDMDKEDLESEAQALNIKIKVFDIDTKQSFNRNFRNEYEPFRTKDVQTVLWRKLQRQINITQYQNQGVIQEVFSMHDMHEIHEMKKIWYRGNKTGSLSFAGLNFNLILMPIPLIRSFFLEGSEFRYSELAAIKNYFGEKVGFQYAWMSFYTVWLTLPTIVGIALTIFQMVKGVDTPLTTMYALFVCVWVTVFIERWKRKAAEICLRWGLSNMVFNTLENRIQRDEFHGYEAFNHDSHKTEMKTMRTIWTWIYLILQIPLYIILIALCIGSFILQEWIKAKGLSLQTKTYQPSTNTTSFSSNISLGNVTLNNFSNPINQTLPDIPLTNSSIFDNSSQPVLNITNSIIADSTAIILSNLTNSTLRFLVGNSTSTTSTSSLSLLENPGTLNLLVGFVNAVFIEIFDFIYSYAATYYVNLENHKFLDSFEKSFVFKMFIFKFINTNISIFYTAFIADRNDKNKFDNLYYLLLGMAGTKSIKIFILKNLKKIVTVWAYKRWYFRKVIREAIKQRMSQNCYRDDNQIIHQKGDHLSDRSFRRMIKNSDSKEIIPPTSEKLQRSIFNTDPKKKDQRVLIDYIEMNSLMIESSELIYINERTDVFVIFGLATLYCCACPVVPLIAMIHNMIDMNMDLYVCYTSTKRPLQKTMTNIGPWLAIAEFMAFAAVVSNCLLLYFSTNSLREWLKTTQIGLGPTTGQNDIYLLFLIIGVEHCIVLIKQLVAELVPDVPPWVEKAQHRIARQEEEMAMREEEEDEERKNEIAKKALAKIKEMSERRVQIMGQIQKEIGKLKETVGEKQGEIVQLQAEKAKMQEELRVANALSQKAVKEAEQKLQKKFGLSDFLQINENEWLAKERGLQLDIALNKNLQKRLFIQSFNQLEKEILTRRLGKLFDTKQTCNSAIHLLTGGLQINCAQCLQAMATIECIDCVDHFCKICCDQIHNSELEICKDHRFIDLNFQVGSEKPKVMRWKKFEYFNFPLVEQNALFQQIQLLYNFFKTFYINQNYVEQDKQLLSLKSFFLDRNYHFMTDIQGQIQLNQDEQMFGQLITEKPKDRGIKEMVQAKSQFNEEELFYLNLIANYLLQNDSLNFENFIKTLGTLQGGTLVKRTQLWFKIMNATQINRNVPTREALPEDEVLTVSRKNLEDAFRFSFIQLRPLSPSIVKPGQPKDYKQIIDMIFSDDKQTERDYQTITLKRFMEVVNSNEDINEFMCAVLQFKGVSNFVIPSGTTSQSVLTTSSSK